MTEFVAPLAASYWTINIQHVSWSLVGDIETFKELQKIKHATTPTTPKYIDYLRFTRKHNTHTHTSMLKHPAPLVDPCQETTPFPSNGSTGKQQLSVRGRPWSDQKVPIEFPHAAPKGRTYSWPMSIYLLSQRTTKKKFKLYLSY